MGKDAIISEITKHVYPSVLIRTKFPNLDKEHRLENCGVLHQEVKNVHQKDQLCLICNNKIFAADDVLLKLYVIKNHCKFVTEGPRDLFYTEPENEERIELQCIELPVDVQHTISHAMVGEEEMALLCTVLEVDDDNLPAPDTTGSEGDIFKDWQEVQFCYQKKEIF